MEVPSRKPTESVSDARRRIDIAFEFIAREPAANSPEEAREMFRRAFADAERDVPVEKRRLNLASVSDMPEVLQDGKRVRVSRYRSHALLLGESGAIEVLIFPEAENNLPEEEYAVRHADFQRVFEKAGADGKHLWDG